MDAQEYDKAAFTFSLLELENFKDSSNMKKESYYRKAENLLENGDFDNAEKQFESLDQYSDSVERIKECHYLRGDDYLDRELYSSAISEYEKAEDYKDADQKKSIAEEKYEEEKEEIAHKDAMLKLSYAASQCFSHYTSLSSDGLSLTVDGQGEYDFVSWYDIKTICEELSLPDSLITEMESTNALMGRQTERYDEYEISWSYHPDNGIDAVFKVIK